MPSPAAPPTTSGPDEPANLVHEVLSGAAGFAGCCLRTASRPLPPRCGGSGRPTAMRGALLEPVEHAVVVRAGALRVPRVRQGSVLALRRLVLVGRLLVVRPAAHPGGVMDAVVGRVGGRQGRRRRGRGAEEDTSDSDSDGRGSKTCAQRNPPLTEQKQRELIAFSTTSPVVPVVVVVPVVSRCKAQGTRPAADVPVRARLPHRLRAGRAGQVRRRTAAQRAGPARHRRLHAVAGHPPPGPPVGKDRRRRSDALGAGRPRHRPRAGGSGRGPCRDTAVALATSSRSDPSGGHPCGAVAAVCA